MRKRETLYSFADPANDRNGHAIAERAVARPVSSAGNGRIAVGEAL